MSASVFLYAACAQLLAHSLSPALQLTRDVVSVASSRLMSASVFCMYTLLYAACAQLLAHSLAPTLRGIDHSPLRLQLKNKRSTLEEELSEIASLNRDYVKAMNDNALSSLEQQTEACVSRNAELTRALDKDYETWKVMETEGVNVMREFRRRQEQRDLNHQKLIEEKDDLLRRCAAIGQSWKCTDDMSAAVEMIAAAVGESGQRCEEEKLDPLLGEVVLCTLGDVAEGIKQMIDYLKDSNEGRMASFTEMLTVLKGGCDCMETSV